MRTGFWHHDSISSHKILVIYNGESQLTGGGIGRHRNDQVLNINIMDGEGFKEEIQITAIVRYLLELSRGQQRISDML